MLPMKFGRVLVNAVLSRDAFFPYSHAQPYPGASFNWPLLRCNENVTFVVFTVGQPAVQEERGEEAGCDHLQLPSRQG